MAQGPIVDIPHAAERPAQVHNLFRSWVEAVAIGFVRHLQIISESVIDRILLCGLAIDRPADGSLSLPSLKAGVSREGN